MLVRQTVFSEISEPSQEHPAPAMVRRQLEDMIKKGGNRSQAFVAGLRSRHGEAYIAKKPVSLLRFSLENEEFPVITGLPTELSLDGVVRASRSNLSKEQWKDSRNHLQVRVEHITPERAEEILKYNDGNRRVAAAAIDKYARDIAAGV